MDGGAYVDLAEQVTCRVVVIFGCLYGCHRCRRGAVVDFLAVGQGFDQQPTSSIAQKLSDQFATIVTELGFLQQSAVEVVLVGGATTVEAGFLLDQAVGVIVEVVMPRSFSISVSSRREL
jgi:hypothetical protein